MHHRDRDYSDDRGWQFGRRGFGGFGSGFGPFGGGFAGPGGRGGRIFRAGKMLADGDLRLIVLALLEDGPRHGYDIIKALEERSHGIYSPSPGVVYPTLTFLEEAGFATATSEGNKKTYAITAAGRTHLDENREIVEMVLNGMDKFGRKMARARAWWEGGEEQRSAPDRDIPDVVPELNEARRTLKAAIAERLGTSVEEQRRVAGILRDAAGAIRAKDAEPAVEPEVDL
jgi:DNA-binding PadR family transcriptional regulator